MSISGDGPAPDPDGPDFDEGYADKLTAEAVERATRELREVLGLANEAWREKARLAEIDATNANARAERAEAERDRFKAANEDAKRVTAERDRLRAALAKICTAPVVAAHNIARAALKEGQ